MKTDETLWFVASTLPLRAVADARVPRPTHIVCSRAALIRSYEGVLSSRGDPTGSLVDYSVLEGSFPKQLFAALGILRQARKVASRVVYFHECCWPALDFALRMSRCRAIYAPQVSLAEFETASWGGVIRRSTGRSKARALLLLPFFKFKSVLEQGREQLVPIARKYPKSFVIIERTSGPFPRVIDQSSSRNVLMLGAIDVVDAAEIRRVFLEIVLGLTNAGFTCYFKDHPNPDHRMGSLRSSAVREIEPEIPAEALEIGFRCSIGLFSTALPRVGFATVSIGPLWRTSEPDEIDQRSRFLRQESQGRKILWCNSVDEVISAVINTESKAALE